MLILKQLYLYCLPAKWDHVLNSICPLTQCMCRSPMKGTDPTLTHPWIKG